MATDLRELSFQNVIDTILKPAGIKVGGYPEDIFLDLTEEQKDQWICNICYLIVREARECDNKHMFCHTCVFAWTMTYGENSQKCPLCRNVQQDYTKNKSIDRQLEDKKTKCPEPGCVFKAPLKILLMHSHGKARFVNDREDLESLRPERPAGARLLVLAGPPQERVRSLRDQLSQGRMMLHQMMMLLHLEMQLRQQALVSFSQAREPTARLQRLDEVLALNEQLGEVGTILSGLMSIPARGSNSQGTSTNNNQGTTSSNSQGMSSSRSQSQNRTPAQSQNRTPGLLDGSITSLIQNNRRPVANHDDSDSDTSIESTSTDSTVVRARARNVINRGPAGTFGRGSSQSSTTVLNRPLRRSEIREQISSIGVSDESPRPMNLTQRGGNSTVLRRVPESVSAMAAARMNRGSSPERSITTVQNLNTSTNAQTPASNPGRTSLPGAGTPALPPINTVQSPGRVSQTGSSTPSGPILRGSNALQRTLQEMDAARSSGSQATTLNTVHTTTPSRTFVTASGAIVTADTSLPRQTVNRGTASDTTRETPASNQINASSSQQSPQNAESTSNQNQDAPNETSTTNPNSQVPNSTARANSEVTIEPILQPTRSDTSPQRTDGQASETTAQRRGSQSTYAPQRRFRRDSTTDQRSQGGRQNSLSNTTNSTTRSTSRSQSLQRRPSHAGQSEARSNDQRVTGRANSLSRRPSQPREGTGQRGSSDNNLPNTPGQLLRSRRRSEIRDELTRKE